MKYLTAIMISSTLMSCALSESCDRGKIADRKYLFYDINPGEGFNLRRDVYMRIATTVKKLRNLGDWVLVLPPWGPLYHWKSRDLGIQAKIPWSRFFDVESLKKFVPVVELHELLEDRGRIKIDQVFYLQHYKDAWASGKWEEKFEIGPCEANVPYEQKAEGYRARFWTYANISTRNLKCVSFQGHASKLISLLDSVSDKPWHYLMVDRAEIPLHDEYGSAEYWKVRRSMRFANRLYSLAHEFRIGHLNSNDTSDKTALIDDWRDERPHRPVAKGGPYICGHLRRQDFLRGRPNDVPSLKFAAHQLGQVLRALNLENVFIASDGTDEEMEELRSYLSPDYKLVLYRPDLKTRREIQDGGVAIVEQIICSRARHFIGSFESTFSFRIQEEREILHFPADSTFNRFCGDGQKTCEQPAKWKITF